MKLRLYVNTGAPKWFDLQIALDHQVFINGEHWTITERYLLFGFVLLKRVNSGIHIYKIRGISMILRWHFSGSKNKASIIFLREMQNKTKNS